jgi:hypothetical protein
LLLLLVTSAPALAKRNNHHNGGANQNNNNHLTNGSGGATAAAVATPNHQNQPLPQQPQQSISFESAGSEFLKGKSELNARNLQISQNMVFVSSNNFYQKLRLSAADGLYPII